MQSTKNIISKWLKIASLLYIASATILLCVSSKIHTEYVYKYESNIASGHTGFRFTAEAHLGLLYSGADGQLVKLWLTQPVFYGGPTTNDQPLVIDSTHDNNLYNPDHNIYAHIVTLSNGTAYVEQLYTHQADSATFKNIKKSILINLLPTSHHVNSQKSLNNPVFIDDNNDAQPELFSPDSSSQVSIVAKARQSTENDTNSIESFTGTKIFQSVEGYQNVTFRSRVFTQAESNLTTRFRLELVDELKQATGIEKFDQANYIQGAIELVDRRTYLADTVGLQRERQICSTDQHCDRVTLAKLLQNYKDSLTDKSLASVDASVAFLRILNRIRDTKDTSSNEILTLLKSIKGNDGVLSSFLDILAAARTEDSIMAALKYLKLAKNKNLNTAERFLSVLSVAAKTASKMHLRRPLQSPYYFTPTSALKRGQAAKERLSQLAPLEFIAQKLLHILDHTPADKWSSHKLRWSTLLTLATLVNANNHENNYETTEDELNQRVSKLLLNELRSCPKSDADCRIVALQAIGNVGHLKGDQFQVIKEHIMGSGRRESISAMKVLRDLLQNQAKDTLFTQEFISDLKNLLLRVVYDSSQETTCRVLAAEMIVRFLPNSLLASEQLLHHLPSFGNNELATMIYSRMQSFMPEDNNNESMSPKHHENWYWKSSIINGASASFVRTLAKTDSLNASYGVNVELLNKGKILKESSFDVFLDTRQRTQDLFSLGIFARGLSSFAGGSDDDDDGDGSGDESGNEVDDNTMAGMTLRLLGGYLRPYVFFDGTGELMSHIWAGTASEPTTAFSGDLLLIDHDEGYPLISGFIVEQQMQGVLSIDVSGQVQISLWRMNSHSVVRTKASVIVQASQSVFTGFENFWHSHLFSFGGQAMIDFVADAAFSSSPFKICLQVTQPEFSVTHVSRRHDQMMTNQVRRKTTSQNYLIGAKSYSLNAENNRMCSLMST